MIRKFLTATVALTLIFGPFLSIATAGDPTFQTTKEEMVQELTRKPEVKYRSFVQAKPKRAIVVAEKNEAVVQEKTLLVEENPEVPQLRLKIEFDYNSAVLRPSSYPVLNELGQALTSSELSNAKLVIIGHTDSDGDEAYNRMLSLDRAQSVKIYLVGQYRISDERLKILGYGEAMPLMPNTNAENKQKNRRVEVQTSE